VIAAAAIVAASAVGRTIVHAQRRSHTRHDPHGGRVAPAWEARQLAGVARHLTEDVDPGRVHGARPIGDLGVDALADAETTCRFGP
jgi:hypothetical protein